MQLFRFQYHEIQIPDNKIDDCNIFVVEIIYVKC